MIELKKPESISKSDYNVESSNEFDPKFANAKLIENFEGKKTMDN